MHEESSLAVVDTTRMADLVNSLGPALADVIEIFLEDVPVQIAGMQAALACGDRVELQAIAHTLKSSAGIFGALQMVDLCRSLEGEDDAARQAALIQQVAVAFQKLQAVLNLYR